MEEAGSGAAAADKGGGVSPHLLINAAQTSDGFDYQTRFHCVFSPSFEPAPLDKTQHRGYLQPGEGRGCLYPWKLPQPRSK